MPVLLSCVCTSSRWQTVLPPHQIIFDCMALYAISTRLRAARFASGALRLNNTRLCFALDTGGNPVSAAPYIQSEANWLVEEYMLLANMRVAAIIANAFPQHAMLRCGQRAAGHRQQGRRPVDVSCWSVPESYLVNAALECAGDGCRA